jgi:hypothetical protein
MAKKKRKTTKEFLTKIEGEIIRRQESEYLGNGEKDSQEETVWEE